MRPGFLYGLALGLTFDRLAQIAAGFVGDYLRHRTLAAVVPIEGRLHP